MLHYNFSIQLLKKIINKWITYLLLKQLFIFYLLAGTMMDKKFKTIILMFITEFSTFGFLE